MHSCSGGLLARFLQQWRALQVCSNAVSAHKHTQHTTRHTQPNTDSWSDAQFSAGDKVYRLVKGDTRVKDGFFWTSHTFSHPMLDNVTSDTMRLQLELNARMAGDEFLGVTGRPGYSNGALVTPAISGLFNGDALAAMAAAGINTVGALLHLVGCSWVANLCRALQHAPAAVKPGEMH